MDLVYVYGFMFILCLWIYVYGFSLWIYVMDLVYGFMFMDLCLWI